MKAMHASAEVQLVIECTRAHATAESAARIRKYIESGVSWMKVVTFAIVHGVLPLVANTLTSCSSDLLPKDVLFQLERALLRAEARNLRQWIAISDIESAFAGAGVRLLAFKGAALTSFVYRDLRLRESHDIDLWAAPEDTEKAGKILGSIGYAPMFYEIGETFAHDKIIRFKSEAKQNREFYNTDRDIVVDLQNTKPTIYFTPDFNVIWDQRSKVTGPDISASTLSRENYLVALAVHGEKHLWRRMNWIIDVDRILTTSPELDWDRILDHASRWRCLRRLASTLAIRSRLFQVPAANSDVRKYLTHWTTERVLASMTREDVTSMPPTLRTRTVNSLSHFLLIDNFGDRAHSLAYHTQRQIRSVLDDARVNKG